MSNINEEISEDKEQINEFPSDLIHIENDEEHLIIPEHGDERADSGDTSTLGSVFLIINAALGAGLLNFPKAFDTAGGVLVAVLVQAVLLVFIMSALIILARTSDIKGSVTLQELMGTVSGRVGTMVTSIIVAVYTFGTCITFLIIIGDQFDRALESTMGPRFCDHFYLNREFLVPVSSVVIILPLCYTKRIDFLKYVSMLGVLTIVYVVMLIVIQYALGNYSQHQGRIKTAPDDWLDVMTVVPVICFGYQCHVSVIPIYSCMRHRNIKHFSIASSAAILVCCLTYTGAATFGYLTFGGNVADDILLNYSAKQPAVMIALIAMAAKTYTTYPILLFCGREAISTIIKDTMIREDSERKEKIRRALIATIWFVATLVIAIEVPDIGIVINLLGSLAAVFIFVFPGVCLWQTTLNQVSQDLIEEIISSPNSSGSRSDIKKINRPPLVRSFLPCHWSLYFRVCVDTSTSLDFSKLNIFITYF